MLEIPTAKAQTPIQEPKSSPLEIGIGVLFLLLILPVISFSIRELTDIADSLEYGGDMIDMLNSMVYSLTTVSILLVLGPLSS